MVRGGADPHRREMQRRDGAAAHARRRMGDRASPVRRTDLRLPGRFVSARGLGGRCLGRQAPDSRGGLARRHRRRPEARPRQGFDREALRVGGGVPLRGSGRPSVRRPRLHARIPRRAVLPRAASRPDLGGDVRDPAVDRRARAREARRRAGRGLSTAGARPEDAEGGPSSIASRVVAPRIDLRPLFAPASIAVVGASARGGIAQTVRDNLVTLGSTTRCYFVNPRYAELHGEPCYPSLDALPERPDSVLAAVSPAGAVSVAADAGRLGVRAMVIPGGGVVEGGAAAAAMQREVREIAVRHGIALLGPNCMGVVDLTTRSAAYIGDVNPWMPRGGVAGIAQSGSVTDAFIHSGSRIGFSRIIGCGSEAVLDVCDFLAHSIDDDETEAVILFVEGFKRPERFLALADRALALGKPILAVKVGRSRQAQAAAIAHSGSLAGDAGATDAALAAAGVVVCDDLDRLLETAELVAGCRRLGRMVGRGRTGVVTVSTGEASLIADLVPETGVDLPAVPADARAALARDLPTLGYVGNPLDPWGATDPATAYAAAFEAFASCAAFDVLALVHDFPYRSLPSEVETALEVLAPLVESTRDRPDILPVYVSLT